MTPEAANPEPGLDHHRTTSSRTEIFRLFLRLGLTCFGGPIAHIEYFRDEFVVRRQWIDEHGYADLVSLCQFLPGPASSKVGFCIGLMRAGYPGAIAAWAGFTLPSAIILVCFAYVSSALHGPVGQGLLHGLKLAAVAIVAQAVWSMAHALCPDRERASIAAFSAIAILATGSSAVQIVVIVLGAIAGLWFCRGSRTSPGLVAMPVSRTAGVIAFVAFAVLFLGLPLLASFSQSSGIALFDAFYRSGALVFGGGHVVLPLLREAFVTPGWISDNAFLAGYGAAQAIPGPLFAFAAYLGTIAPTQTQGLSGAALGLVGIFLPGFLILLGTLPLWDALRRQANAQAAMRGINAAVVGLLGAAFYNPVWTGTIHSVGDVCIALTGFILLNLWQMRPLGVVVFCATAGIAMSFI